MGRDAGAGYANIVVADQTVQISSLPTTPAGSQPRSRQPGRHRVGPLSPGSR